MSSNWGSARKSIIALLPDIKKRLASGDSVSSIYRELATSGKITCQRSGFGKQLKNLLETESSRHGAKWVGLPERRPVHSGVVQTRDVSPSSRSYLMQGQSDRPAAPAMTSIQTNDDFTKRAFQQKRDFALNALSRGVGVLDSTTDSTGDK